MPARQLQLPPVPAGLQKIMDIQAEFARNRSILERSADLVSKIHDAATSLDDVSDLLTEEETSEREWVTMALDALSQLADLVNTNIHKAFAPVVPPKHNRKQQTQANKPEPPPVVLQNTAPVAYPAPQVIGILRGAFGSTDLPPSLEVALERKFGPEWQDQPWSRGGGGKGLQRIRLVEDIALQDSMVRKQIGNAIKLVEQMNKGSLPDGKVPSSQLQRLGDLLSRHTWQEVVDVMISWGIELPA